jgi:hypothetical protein
LDGDLGTTEGGARLLQELMDEGVQGCETLSPQDLTGQIRKIVEAANVNTNVHDVIKCLRFHRIHTGLLCNQWSQAGVCNALI